MAPRGIWLSIPNRRENSPVLQPRIFSAVQLPHRNFLFEDDPLENFFQNPLEIGVAGDFGDFSMEVEIQEPPLPPRPRRPLPSPQQTG